jgi:hypothetical protein
MPNPCPLLGKLYHGLVICVHPPVLPPTHVDSCFSGRSALSLDEKYVVVSNLYDGLDWYSTTDRALSHTTQCPINQQMNHPVPVLFACDGSAIIVGGTCGSARILDTKTSETVQTLPHDGISVDGLRIHFVDFCVVGDVIQALV